MKCFRFFGYLFFFFFINVLIGCADDGQDGANGQDGADGQDLTQPAFATSIDTGPYQCTEEELAEEAEKNCRLYIKGGMNSWSARPEAELTYQGEGKYVALFKMSPGEYEFKIADPDWSAERDLAIGVDLDAAIPMEAEFPLQRKFDDFENQNMQIQVTGDEDQTYRFTLDASQSIDTPSLKVENITGADNSPVEMPMYLVGDFNNWSAHEDFKFNYSGAGRYELLHVFDEAGYINFRVQQGDEFGRRFGSLANNPITLYNGDSVITAQPGGNISANVEQGAYYFSFTMLGDNQAAIPVGLNKVRATAGHDQITAPGVPVNLTGDGSLFADVFNWEIASTDVDLELNADTTQGTSNKRVNATPNNTGSFEALLTINPDYKSKTNDLVRINVVDVQPAKNIILFIGDGMGYPQVEAARMYKGSPLAMDSFEAAGTLYTASADTLGFELDPRYGQNYYTDSAAAATALATGRKATSGTISVAQPGNGEKYETIMEYAQKRGMSIGIVATSDCAHATPAAFVAHGPSRRDYAALSQSIFTEVKPNLTFCGSRTYDGTDMHTVNATEGGYTLVHTATELNALTLSEESLTDGSFRLAAIFGPQNYDTESSGIPYVLPNDDQTTKNHTYAQYDIPSIATMSEKAVDLLSHNPNGFILMIEGSQIDWAGHNNDIERNVQETLAMDEAVEHVINWAEPRNDTMVMVTADHECGGLEVLENKGANAYPEVKWKWGSHTNQPVPIAAWGLNANVFANQNIDNTSVYNVMRGALQ